MLRNRDKDEVEKASGAVDPRGGAAAGVEDYWKSRAAKSKKLAAEMLAERGISVEAAARLVLEALERSDDRRRENENDLQRARRIVLVGAEYYRQSQHTVTFWEMVNRLLCHKHYRRERTLQEILQHSRRMVRTKPELYGKLVRFISPQECRNIIVNTYPTLVMQHKARTLLHGLFAFAMRQGWCSVNPLDQVEFPPCPERRIQAMDITQVRRLLEASLTPKHLPCAPALGLLLWAGVRPRELERLTWDNINFHDLVITVPPQHAKTGGARHITMQPILKKWLLKVSVYRVPGVLIVPPSWGLRWRMLRQASGFGEWRADILRHTFASFHLRHFRNLNNLQLDMGHGSPELLRTRYLNMEGVTAASARLFWEMDFNSLVPRCLPPVDTPAKGRGKRVDFPMLDD